MTLSFRQLRDFYREHEHIVPGVEPGPSEVNSVAPLPSFGGIGVDLGGVGGGGTGGTGSSSTTSPTSFSALAAVSAPAGTPVYISKANGQLYPANSAATLTSLVVGLLTANAVAGFIATYDRELIVLSDWTAITGSSALLIGQTYFLGAAGTLTTTVPTSGTSTRIGEALGSSSFAIFPAIIPILL